MRHHYGGRVQIVGDALSLGQLARLSARATTQPEVGRLVGELYRALTHAVLAEAFPRARVEVATRMIEHTPRGVWTGEVVDPATHAVVVSVARAGIFPSHICYHALNHVLDPAGVRQDHMNMARTTDAAGQVTGAAIHGAKIGGSIGGAFVLIPDPMGATGSTVATVLDHYRAGIEGTPAAIVAINLIVTPEYLRRVLALRPEVTVFALRVDRGLSPPDVLARAPGERWDEERGLNAHGYIVPGAGGLGEVLNNSWV